ncbi:hypothetical protein H310_11439 [Aphanomyces invadans]|uniref:Uncharacterized protein n=1 Tax=Aphanomyces invadans TaxID=157072 RepID=A0A024TP78_9STRA|nr:hypothetical protein H310_11439 [Aphanomyces invadans]ETV95177.1 hypothetical protein H310_11439 [Aphanomyces invadans]|eukprot:XP_008876350.1 hypothetical protein H310_11439 [Aphanomyces invadans]
MAVRIVATDHEECPSLSGQDILASKHAWMMESLPRRRTPLSRVAARRCSLPLETRSTITTAAAYKSLVRRQRPPAHLTVGGQGPHAVVIMCNRCKAHCIPRHRVHSYGCIHATVPLHACRPSTVGICPHLAD